MDQAATGLVPPSQNLVASNPPAPQRSQATTDTQPSSQPSSSNNQQWQGGNNGQSNPLAGLMNLAGQALNPQVISGISNILNPRQRQNQPAQEE